jgi:hypothetical protein
VVIEKGPQFLSREDDSYAGVNVHGTTIGARLEGEGQTGVGMIHLGAVHDNHWLHPGAYLGGGSVSAHRMYEASAFSRTGDQQGTLFRSSAATPWTVDLMAVRNGHEHLVPALLGLAAEHSLRRSGRLPQATNDLSSHSNRLVDKLTGRGLVDDPREVGNFEPNHITRGVIAQSMIDNEGVEEQHRRDHLYSDADVQRASNVTRALLRATRPPKARPEPEQGTLF